MRSGRRAPGFPDRTFAAKVRSGTSSGQGAIRRATDQPPTTMRRMVSVPELRTVAV